STLTVAQPILMMSMSCLALRVQPASSDSKIAADRTPRAILLIASAARYPTTGTPAGLLFVGLFCPLRFSRCRFWLLSHAVGRFLSFATGADSYSSHRTLAAAPHRGYFHATVSTLALDLRLTLMCWWVLRVAGLFRSYRFLR